MEKFLKIKNIKTNTDKVSIYCDGACPNNGRKNATGGAGAVILNPEKEVIVQLCENLNHLKLVTNNITEYKSLILGLKGALDRNLLNIHVYMDSKLVCEQIKGNYKVKSSNLIKYYRKAKDLIKQFNKFQISHIRREFNKHADRLANQALDKTT
jgi:ribonuclease HI